MIATFRCGDGTAMQVDFDDERVEIELADGRNFRLARAPSGSGAKYSDGQNLFWEHRGEAYIVLEGEAFDQCVAD